VVSAIGPRQVFLEQRIVLLTTCASTCNAFSSLLQTPS
jgi:hypothetical protein